MRLSPAPWTASTSTLSRDELSALVRALTIAEVILVSTPSQDSESKQSPNLRIPAMQIIHYDRWDHRMFCPVTGQPGADRRQRLNSSVVVDGFQVSTSGRRIGVFTDRKTFLSPACLALQDDRFRIPIR